MNNLTRTLLGSAALCALATAPAMAGDVPAFHITALHAGKVVNKTTIHNQSRTHLTYTFGVYTYVSASDLNIKVKLSGTGYSFGCSASEKARITKQAKYGKAGIDYETYSTGCGGAGEVYAVDTYKLTNPAGEGRTDHFTSSLIGKYENSGVKYKATLNLDVGVGIE
jgi:hypothetical protein